MFTYNQVTNCSLKNREFWSFSAMIQLYYYRQHKRVYGSDFGLTKSYRVAFRDRMHSRRKQKHLKQ